MTLETIGWIGSIAFALSALPQAIKSYREGHSYGISWGLIFFWTVGEWCSLAYVLPMWKWPLIINYLGNIVFCGIVTWYKFFPREDAEYD